MGKEIVAMLLAGGQGTRLYSLTQKIAKPAVPFGGKYRIIDFPLSNCVNSGIDTVGVLTQYQPYVLNEYIGNGQPWDLDRLYGGVHVLPPYQKTSGSDWYTGTANAIYQNIPFIEKFDPKYVIILSGDQICKQDYRELLDFHKEKGADCTIAVRQVPVEESWRYGMVTTDRNDRVVGFQEKPKISESDLASMGIYIFTWPVLHKYLVQDDLDNASDHDFGKNLFPKMLKEDLQVFAFHFHGYWKDVGSIENLWETNMEVLDPEHSGINLFDDNWKIYSRNSGMPGHRISAGAVIENAMITDGCNIKGTVRHSILSSGVIVEAGAVVEDSVIMDGAIIKTGAYISNAIIGENTFISENARIGGPQKEGEPLKISTIGHGATIGEDAVISAGTVIYQDVEEGAQC